MHFEPEKGEATYAVMHLRNDAHLVAVIRATNGGIRIDVAQGFETEDGFTELHIEIRERPSGADRQRAADDRYMKMLDEERSRIG